MRLSSDLQLLVQPRAPPVDTLVGFFFQRERKYFLTTLITTPIIPNQIKISANSGITSSPDNLHQVELGF